MTRTKFADFTRDDQQVLSARFAITGSEARGYEVRSRTDGTLVATFAKRRDLIRFCEEALVE